MRKNCTNCKYDVWDYAGAKPCSNCGSKGDEAPTFWEAAGTYVPDTNADRIRSMTDEELAKFVDGKRVCPPTSECSQVCGGDCVDCWLEWLQQPAENPNEV